MPSGWVSGWNKCCLACRSLATHRHAAYCYVLPPNCSSQWPSEGGTIFVSFFYRWQIEPHSDPAARSGEVEPGHAAWWRGLCSQPPPYAVSYPQRGQESLQGAGVVSRMRSEIPPRQPGKGWGWGEIIQEEHTPSVHQTVLNWGLGVSRVTGGLHPLHSLKGSPWRLLGRGLQKGSWGDRTGHHKRWWMRAGIRAGGQRGDF